MLAPAEGVDSRNRGDAELCRDGGVLIYVDLDDLNLVGVLCCELLQDGGEHAAGAAPLCPEVHQDRLICLENILLEACVGHILEI